MNGSGKEILILVVYGNSSVVEKISRGVVVEGEREDGKLQKGVLIDITMEIETNKKEWVCRK